MDKFIVAEQAHNAIMQHLLANKYKFSKKQPTENDWGRLRDDGFFIILSVLKRELQTLGFNWDAVKKQWAKREYIGLPTCRGSYYHQRREHGKRVDYIHLLSFYSPLSTCNEQKQNSDQEVKEIIKLQIELLHEASESHKDSTRELVDLSRAMASLCVEYFGRL